MLPIDEAPNGVRGAVSASAATKRDEPPFRGNAAKRRNFILHDNKTSRLAMDAMLAALCTVLSYASIDIGNSMRITLESFPIAVGALLLGPLDGAAIAFVGNLIYQLLRHGITATTLLWIAPYVIAGSLIGLAAKGARGRVRVVAVMLTAELLITALNTGALYIDSKLYGYYGAYLFALTVPRLALAMAKGAVFGVILPPLTDAVRRALPQLHIE